MLQNFRTNLRGLALGITIVIGVIFALSGTGSLFVATPDSETALVVNGENISEREFQLALIAQKNRILSENPDLDQALLDDEQMRPSTLQQLVSRKVLAQASEAQKLGVSKSLISDLIRDEEQFQTDGKFDQDKFRFSIRNQGYASSADFIDMLEGEFLILQLSQAILSSSFITESELRGLAAVTEQQRDYSYTRLPIQPFKDQASVSKQAIAEHYQKTSDNYVTEFQVSVQYIELNPSMLMSSQQVTDDQIQARFDLEAESVESQPSLRAAHILLEDDSSVRVAEIQAKLDAGAEFAALARDYSDDFASASNGGDLGFTAGDTFPKAFEEALAKLQVGEISLPVTTDAGVHIIKLLERQESTFTFDTQRERIAEDLIKEAVNDVLVEKLEQLKELSFNAENLDEVAEELELKAWVTEPFAARGGVGIASFPPVVKAAYSPEVLEDGYASEVLELGDDRYVVIKLQEQFPARQKPLEEVSEQVKVSLIDEIARQNIAQQGETLLARIKAGESVEDVAKSLDLQWQVVSKGKRGAMDTDSEINNFVFQLPATRKNSIVDSFYTANGDFIALKMKQVTMGDYGAMAANEKNLLRSVVEPTYSGREILAYRATLVNQADIIQ